MKILYLMDHVPNYGSLFLFDGLCDQADLFIIDKPNFEDECVRPYLRLPLKYSEVSIDEALNVDFDLVVISNEHEKTLEYARKYAREFLYKKIPFTVYMNSDTPGIKWDIVNEFNTKKFFLREYYYNESYPSDCHPLPFASPFDTYPAVSIAGRPIDILFAMSGQNNPARITWCDLLKEHFSHTNSIFNLDRNFERDEYFEMLKQSKIVIDIRGFGADTVRFYEAIAHGAFLITNETMLHRPHPFINHYHVCYTEESRVVHWCNYYLSLHRERIFKAKNAQRHLVRYHTTEKMAERFLSKVKEML